MHPLIGRATHFAVHLPEPRHSKLCDHFATSGQTAEEQFEDVEHYRSAYGSPILRNISTVIQCRTYDQIVAGDHTIIVGEVVEVEQENTKASILYYDQLYRSVGEIVPRKKNKIKRAG
jgi:flavin reductase (DIM6/NTAB) family NADH-FMN oxidoreductase RutF